MSRVGDNSLKIMISSTIHVTAMQANAREGSKLSVLVQLD